MCPGWVKTYTLNVNSSFVFKASRVLQSLRRRVGMLMIYICSIYSSCSQLCDEHAHIDRGIYMEMLLPLPPVSPTKVCRTNLFVSKGRLTAR